MNSMKENMVLGLLVALTIGPSLSLDPSLSLAVRLTSILLGATVMGVKWAMGGTSWAGKGARSA